MLVNKNLPRDEALDLHGLHANEAIEILRMRLSQIQSSINSGRVRCNEKGDNHVVKVMCGAGTHSMNGPVLKNIMAEFLRSLGYEFLNKADFGIILVRLRKS